MTKIFLIFILLTLTATTQAEQKSILGIDYLKVTKNPIIAQAMLEMEPALIEYYQKGEWAGSTKEDWIYILRGTAIVLGQDRVSKDTFEVIRKVVPEVPIKFLKLDKKKYSNLWKMGNIVRLQKEKEESLWLYRALHGRDYYEDHQKK